MTLAEPGVHDFSNFDLGPGSKYIYIYIYIVLNKIIAPKAQNFLNFATESGKKHTFGILAGGAWPPDATGLASDIP